MTLLILCKPLFCFVCEPEIQRVKLTWSHTVAGDKPALKPGPLMLRPKALVGTSVSLSQDPEPGPGKANPGGQGGVQGSRRVSPLRDVRLSTRMAMSLICVPNKLGPQRRCWVCM